MYGAVTSAEEAPLFHGGAVRSVQHSHRSRKFGTLAIAVSCVVVVTLLAVHNHGAASGKSTPAAPASFSKLPPVTLYQSSKATGERVAKASTQPLRRSPKRSSMRSGARVVVDLQKQYQRILGYGAAFTDAATINFYKLPSKAQDAVMDAYFGKEGLGYNIGRIPMGSCDFSVDEYNFANVTNDFKMEHFDTSIAYDQKQRIPMLKEAVKRTPDLKLFVSPWSPPAWMKNPVQSSDGSYAQSMIRSAWPQGLLDDPRVKQAWALYFSKFLTAYKASGLSVWGLTIQNEPENSGPWEACVWNASSQTSFLRDHLGPVIRKDHPEAKIIAYDHNKDHLLSWVQTMLRDKKAVKYLDGIGYHWYADGMDRGLDGSYGWNNVREAAELLLPLSKFIMSSESCHCPRVDHSFEGSWARAEHMAHDIIADFNTGTSAWIDWNILLSNEGGPNHSGNLCDSLIYTTAEHDGIGIGPMYHFMAHLSRYVPEGSVRISSFTQGSYSSKHLASRASAVLRGFEATVWPCDSSIRQRWQLTPAGNVMLIDQLTESFQYWKPVCLGGFADMWTGAVTIVACDEPTAGIYRLTPEGALQLDEPAVAAVAAAAAEAAAIAKAEAAREASDTPMVDQNSAEVGPTGQGAEADAAAAAVKAAALDSTSDKTADDGSTSDSDGSSNGADSGPKLCLTVNQSTAVTDLAELSGALVTLSECGSADAGKHKHSRKSSSSSSSAAQQQLWELDDKAAGTVVSKDSGFCLTGGWPFFSASAFVRPDGKLAVVVLNEAQEPVDFDLALEHDGTELAASIPAHSIQTYII